MGLLRFSLASGLRSDAMRGRRAPRSAFGDPARALVIIVAMTLGAAAASADGLQGARSFAKADKVLVLKSQRSLLLLRNGKVLRTFRVAQAAKLGWHNGELYLEAHPDIEQLDRLEETGAFPLRSAAGFAEHIIRAAGTDAGRLDWPVINAALTQRLGTPVRITLERSPPGT